MPDDLFATRAALRCGASTPTQEMERSLRAAQQPACHAVFVQHDPESAYQQASRPGLAALPLAGLAVSVKDLFDVQGQVTRAGSVVLANQPPAAADSIAVARLRRAGASLVGRTQMVEFAFSGVGTNPHYDTPAAFDARWGALPGPARIPGGSSSGAAVSVATGAAWAALGSDTGGSIRIPAALNGLVGFKSTARLVPTQGAMPLSTTLDTACALTRSVRDAVLVHEVLAARTVTRTTAPLSQWRLAVPQNYFLDDLDPAVARAFERTLGVLREAGATIEPIALPLLDTLGTLQSRASFAVEGLTWHRPWLAQHGDQYDPRVRARFESLSAILATDYLALVQARAAWIARMQSALAPYDALLSPTVPIVAPTIASVAPGAERDAAFFEANRLLLRNTSAINVLDGCALSLPCHVQNELPMGLMVWNAALRDDTVLAVSACIEELLQNQ